MEVHRTAPAPLSRLSTRCPSITTEDIELATETDIMNITPRPPSQNGRVGRGDVHTNGNALGNEINAQPPGDRSPFPVFGLLLRG